MPFVYHEEVQRSRVLRWYVRIVRGRHTPPRYADQVLWSSLLLLALNIQHCEFNCWSLVDSIGCLNGRLTRLSSIGTYFNNPSLRPTISGVLMVHNDYYVAYLKRFCLLMPFCTSCNVGKIISDPALPKQICQSLGSRMSSP